MEYRELSGAGLAVSRMGFGCWTIGGHGWGKVDDRESIAAVRRALDLGVTFFDTADVYGLGHSEEILAEALGERRKGVVIGTKVGLKWDDRGHITRDLSPKSVLQALDNSLKRLRLECIPLYQMHWPDGQTPIEATMVELARCQQAGKIGHVGCCNFPVALIQDAREIHPLVSVQAPYNILDREVERTLLPYCRQEGLSVLSYSPLAQGLLSAKHGPDSRFAADDVRSRSPYFEPDAYQRNLDAVSRLGEIATRYGKTPAQAAIRWVLEDLVVASAITGIRTPEQMTDNAGALGWNLAEEDRRFIAGPADRPRDEGREEAPSGATPRGVGSGA